MNLKSHIFNLVLTGYLLMINQEAQASWFHQTVCAGRKLADAYQDEQALKLVKAAVQGKVDIVADLVVKGANPNHVEAGAVPPLLWAICADNAEGFEALLKAGADPDLAGDGKGLGDGKGHGLKEDGSIIYSGQSAVLVAARTADPSFLKLALKYGGDPDAARGEDFPNRPLVNAAYYGLLENIKILLSSGTNINAHDPDYFGNTAPVSAISAGGRFDIAVWLLEKGYSYNLPELAAFAEGRKLPLEDEQQLWKEKLIHMLREKGIIFPASSSTKYLLEKHDVPPEDIEAIILGHKNALDYPLRKK